MINEIMKEIVELKDSISNIKTVLVDMNARLSELEIKVGLYDPETDFELKEAEAVARAIEHPPQDELKEEEVDND